MELHKDLFDANIDSAEKRPIYRSKQLVLPNNYSTSTTYSTTENRQSIFQY